MLVLTSICRPPVLLPLSMADSASIADLDERGSVGRDTTSEKPPSSSSSDFESDESEYDDINRVKPKTNAINTKEHIQMDNNSAEFSNNNQSKKKEVVEENETKSDLLSNNPLNATQATDLTSIG